MSFTALRTKNDWLNNYKGQTFTERLREEISKGIFQEHSKYKQTLNVKHLLEKNHLITPEVIEKILNVVKGNPLNPMEQLSKKSTVVCLDPITNELLGVGASTLLLDEKDGMIKDNLILDNFGLWYAGIQQANGTTVSIKDNTNTSHNVSIYVNSNAAFTGGGTGSRGSLIQMGSGTAVAVSDVCKDGLDFTALGSSPENGILLGNNGAFTSQRTITNQADANPTGGSGTVREIAGFCRWAIGSSSTADFAIYHDLVTPVVPYTAGKLLRGAYVVSIGS